MFIWNKSFEAAYDSSWCYVEKVSWLNACKPHMMLRQVSNCDVNLSLSSWSKPYSYVDTTWLYVGKRRASDISIRTALCNDLAQSINARSGVNALGCLAPVLLNTQLKVCHACLSEGYHSVVHQVEGLLICPVHELPLSDECPSCHHSLGDFSARRLAASFQCGACGVSFLKDQFLRPPSDVIRQGEQSRIEPILEWLKKVSCVAVHWPDWSPHWRFRRADEHLLRMTTFQASLLPCLSTIHPWPLAENYLEKPAAGLALIPIEDASALYAWYDANRGERESRQASKRTRVFATQVANAVTLAMEQRLEGHHRCLDDVSVLAASIPKGITEVELSANPEMCGVAQAYLIWTSRLRHFIDDLGWLAGQGWSPVLGTPLANLLRTQMESLFYYGAHQVAFLQTLRSFTMMQRYAALCAEDYPRFGRPDERSCRENCSRGVRYMFRLRDEGIFGALRCDQGRYLRQRMDALRGTINAMVEGVHSGKIT